MFSSKYVFETQQTRYIRYFKNFIFIGILFFIFYSFFNGISSKPAALMFSPVNQPDGSKKDTVVNIEATVSLW